ncbi:MAG: hypothetical protein QF412_09940 [Planctomycetota bacterium]|nr:hypothetical protein [Planctomycetota bacterium]
MFHLLPTRKAFAPFACLLLASLPAAQDKNWISNGDFAKGLTGWTAGGIGASPAIEKFSVNGFRDNDCFGINAGNLINGPKGPYILSQKVILAAGRSYSIYADIACETISANASGGIIWIKVAGTEVVRHDYGNVPSQQILRDVLCSSFQTKTSGLLLVEVGFERAFAALKGRTPRVRIDNIELRFSTGPTFCMRGPRKPGNTVTVDVAGRPGIYASFVAVKRVFPGLRIGALAGTLYLDPATALLFSQGQLDAQGEATIKFTIPNNPVLAGASLWWQAFDLVKDKGRFGVDYHYGIQK